MSSIHAPSPARSRPQPQPQPQPQQRRPSGSRPPPVVNPGMPVRAEQAKAILHQFPQPQARPSNPSPSSSPAHAHARMQAQSNHHRASMPNPQSQYKASPTDARVPQQARGPPAPKSNHASISARPLPRTSQSSGSASGYNDSSLKETSRTNIRPGHMAPPRQPSANLAWGHQKALSSKEQQTPPHPGMVSDSTRPQLRESKSDVEMQFEHLLNSLQVPVTVRQKFATVSPDVKSSILLSTLNSNPTILSSLGLPTPGTPQETPKMKKKLSTPLLRKAKSSNEVSSPGSSPQVGKTYDVGGEGFVIVASPDSNSSNSGMMSPPLGYGSMRGQSMDIPRSVRSPVASSSRPLSSLFTPSNSNSSVNSLGKHSGKGLGIAIGEQPDSFIQWLSAHKGTDLGMDVGKAKKLRMLLRHENTAWVGQFIEMRGYELILDRLKDLLDIEWREEQHDDQMLYELLRCVKALSTSEIGKAALRSQFPNPFPSLSNLLFSEKKPGDLASRQIIIELWIFLFDLFPPTIPTASVATPKRQSSIQVGNQPNSVRFDEKTASQVQMKSAGMDIVSEVKGLLIPDLPDPTKDHHEFVTKAHRPRVFKAWVGELSDICRDYFWIMCHASNTLWDLSEVDENLVEKPVAPGGATGGVEFEAMNYVTMHFKLLNALCKFQAIQDKEEALKLHEDLMSSGMDRILVTLRKASTTYYPTLHLELARYVALLKDICPNGKLPYLIGKMVGPPPGEVRRFDSPPLQGREWLPMPGGVAR
ncbi:uncharacterized protein I303_104214 [Kwoniella dejecticola CBS 10117]|uniref:Formin GTPase-binding domain-containing protein n=1 Tax=Kwoniella dejecticola CBS 10117 TaxID=1296121 RepID=A0A1A6A5Z5_9TREE|nr:uncharacterized protein I303_04810 [Kwoniella dejecticola CBS 10117]OBR85474.1 hypothetical protein I303_04810 [Kwoniella dejecticola CBS 10117]